MRKKDNIMVNKPEKKKAIWRRKYIHEVTEENDIKFRAPLSYRHFRILGWLFLAISQISVILKFGETIYSNPGMYGTWPSVLSIFSSLMAPLFLIAAFSVVLNAKDGYRRLLITYGGLSLLIFFAFLFVYEHYIVGVFATATDKGTAHSFVNDLLALGSGSGFLAFNFFLDLLLCTLVTFFINYRPKKFFQGKKIIIFRLFASIPILYEVASIILKICCSTMTITLHPLVFPLLTTKPPLAFFIFVAMAFFVKNREAYFVKKGKTHEEFDKFQETNVNSLHFSIFLSVAIVIAALVDLAVMIGLLLSLVKAYPIQEGIDKVYYLSSLLKTVNAWGFGGVVPMILIVPLVIFFDYKKTYENKTIDLFVPVAGIALIAIVYIEGGFEVLKNKLAELFTEPETPPEGGDGANPLLVSIRCLIDKIEK